MKQRAETAVKPIIEIQKKSVPEIVFDFGLEYARNAIDAMVMDEFTCCFNIEKPKPWNWNFELFLGWIFGGLIRFLILVPLRLCSFLIATLLFLGVFYFCFFTKFLVPRLYFYLDMPKILRVGTKIWLRFWLFMIGGLFSFCFFFKNERISKRIVFSYCEVSWEDSAKKEKPNIRFKSYFFDGLHNNCFIFRIVFHGWAITHRFGFCLFKLSNFKF